VLADDVATFINHGADEVVAKPVRFKKIEECWDKYAGIEPERDFEI
jgi:hypothetical protein